MIKTQEDFFNKIFTSHFICKGSKRVTQGLCVRGSGRTNRTEIFWPLTLMAIALSFLFSWCSTGGLGAHSAGCWLPLQHLISNFSGPQLIRAQKPLRPDVAFPTTSLLQLYCLQLYWHLPELQLNSTGRRTQLSYIIVRRPLDLWNRMFNRHQAEITVMQFRCHSLPVHHTVVAQWDLHLVPYYQS